MNEDDLDLSSDSENNTLKILLDYLVFLFDEEKNKETLLK